MPDLKSYDLFISHAWKYNSDYYNLVEKLENYPNFKFRNYSVPEHDALDVDTKTELNEALDKQVKPVNIVIIIGGMYVEYRQWIQKEIDIAKKYNKPILVIRPHGAERMPQELHNIATKEVSWNIDSIVSAIREISL